VIFGAADVDDGDIGRRRRILDAAMQPVLDPAIAANSVQAATLATPRPPGTRLSHM